MERRRLRLEFLLHMSKDYRLEIVVRIISTITWFRTSVSVTYMYIKDFVKKCVFLLKLLFDFKNHFKTGSLLYQMSEIDHV